MRAEPSILVGDNLTRQGGTSSQPKQRPFDSLDVFIIFCGAEMLPQQAAGWGEDAAGDLEEKARKSTKCQGGACREQGVGTGWSFKVPSNPAIL